MVSLLDVNVLVALFDRAHVHHDASHRWFQAHREAGWATCPITENGFARVVSNPAYPGGRSSVEEAITKLRQFRRSGHHNFWSDAASLCEPSTILAAQIAGYQQITDVYLLALAVASQGRLATFDGRLQVGAVVGASPHHLAVIR